ncbi:MAG: endonuclease/exonuclease/phosphatase family protein [Acidobacteriota bacterium]
MQKLLLVLVCMFIVASCTAPKEAAPPAPVSSQTAPIAAPENKPLRDSLTVLSINTLHALKDDASVKRFASWIKTLGPDVVAVQQIERPQEGKKDFDAVRALALALDMRPFFGMARYYKGFDSGNAVFSIYPIRQSTVESLPTAKGRVRRSLAYAVVDAGLQSIGFASTELDDQSASERAAQVRRLAGLAPEFSDFPFVVCGDFYEKPSGAALASLRGAFAGASGVSGAPQTLTQQLYSASRLVTPAAAKKVFNSDIHSDALLVMLRVVSQ